MGDLHVDGVVAEDEDEEEAGHDGVGRDDGHLGGGRTRYQNEDPVVVGEEADEEVVPDEGLPRVGTLNPQLTLRVVLRSNGVNTKEN